MLENPPPRDGLGERRGTPPPSDDDDDESESRYGVSGVAINPSGLSPPMTAEDEDGETGGANGAASGGGGPRPAGPESPGLRAARDASRAAAASSAFFSAAARQGAVTSSPPPPRVTRPSVDEGDSDGESDLSDAPALFNAGDMSIGDRSRSVGKQPRRYDKWRLRAGWTLQVVAFAAFTALAAINGVALDRAGAASALVAWALATSANLLVEEPLAIAAFTALHHFTEPFVMSKSVWQESGER